MNHKKPTPILAEPNKKICPVCGKQSYSAGGIHPQCAVRQADARGERQLKLTRDAAAKARSETSKPTKIWNQKTCPKCGLEAHVRKKTCVCGFDFVS